MEKYICIHGHFYQPPRENAWLEAVEQQGSAHPYHDWNERIAAECYGANAFSRILGANNRIQEIVNNYEKISFNFGPTLLSWMESNAPDIYEAILDADRKSIERFSGHGSAMAQVGNHMIMPLANERDKYSQVIWGIRDFEHRFGRRPEGMWLPETAVNTETLSVLAESGIRFTVLTQYQARRVRPMGASDWEVVGDEGVDTTMAYRMFLPSGKKIDLFFYDGMLAHAVAFQNLLDSGDALAEKLVEKFSPDLDRGQLVNIATDGETFGHHHAHADMALAYAIYHIESKGLATITNYAEFLDKHPPTHEVQIKENTSWSCVHGVERWHADCGCNSGGHAQWSQNWRQPLRAAFDWLRDELAPLYEKEAERLLKDPWLARDDYIDIILDRSEDALQRFLKRHATSQSMGRLEKIRLLKLLEMQRNAMLMYTSCGWFFDELSGIETVQVIQYAGRAVQLAEEACGVSLESELLERLGQAPSNIAEHGDGQKIYLKFVKPAMVDLSKVCAHYAMISLFEEVKPDEESASVYCYSIRPWDRFLQETGHSRLAVGKAWVKSKVTLEDNDYIYAVLYIGDHTLECAVSPLESEKRYREIQESLEDSFSKVDFPETFRQMYDLFTENGFSLRNMFHDERHRVLRGLLKPTLDAAEADYRRIYEPHVPMMRFINDIGIPMPKALHAAAELVLNADLQRAFHAENLDVDAIDQILKNASEVGLSLDAHTLEYEYRHRMEQIAAKLGVDPLLPEKIKNLQTAVEVAHHLPFEVSFRKTQDLFYDLWRNQREELMEAAKSPQDASEWLNRMNRLADALNFEVEKK